MFIFLIGGAFSLVVWLGVIGHRMGQRGKEIEAKWAASRPSMEPATMPMVELAERIEQEREKQMELSKRYGKKASELYLYCGVLGVLWAIAAMKTWNRRWPGDRN